MADHVLEPSASPWYQRPMGRVVLTALALKILTVAIDPTPLFFMGDSATHIDTALTGHVPRARSYTYGLAIRVFAVWPGTLTTLVIAQSLAGAATAVLLGAVLHYYFRLRTGVVLGGVVLSCVDPLLVVHEHLVLTESFAQLCFAAVLASGLWYLRRPGVPPLAAMGLVGIALVSLRTVYLPAVLASAVCVPLAAAVWPPVPAPWQSRARWAAVHLAVSLAVTAGLHAGYREWIGWLANAPPDYLHERGFFQACAWGPVLTPADATDPRAAGVVRDLTRSTWPLDDPSLREFHRWRAGGLVDRLRRAFGGDGLAADRAARELAGNALRRDPAAVARLAALTYRQYFARLRAAEAHLPHEQGSRGQLPDAFVSRLGPAFGLDAAGIPAARTPSKRYHMAGGPWYWCLAISPLIGFAGVLVAPRGTWVGALFVLLSGTTVLAASCGMGLGPVIRYLCPLSFCTLVVVGILVESSLRAVTGRAGAAEPVSTPTPAAV